MNQHAMRFWLAIALLAAGVALLVLAHGDTAMQSAGGATVIAAVAAIGQVIRQESRADSAANATRVVHIERQVDVAKQQAEVATVKAEVAQAKVETVEQKLDETARNLVLKKDGTP